MRLRWRFNFFLARNTDHLCQFKDNFLLLLKVMLCDPYPLFSILWYYFETHSYSIEKFILYEIWILWNLLKTHTCQLWRETHEKHNSNTNKHLFILSGFFSHDENFGYWTAQELLCYFSLNIERIIYRYRYWNWGCANNGQTICFPTRPRPPRIFGFVCWKGNFVLLRKCECLIMA